MQRIHKTTSLLQLCASAWMMAIIVFTLCLPYLTSQTALAQPAGMTAEEVRQAQIQEDMTPINQDDLEQSVGDTRSSNRAPIIPVDHQSLVLPHSATDEPAETLFFETRIPMLTQLVVTMTAAACFLFIIIGGIQMLTAYGDSEKVEKGKKTITYAIVGLVIAILSYAIVSIISSIQITQAASLPQQPPTLLAQSVDDTPNGVETNNSAEPSGKLIPGRIIPAPNWSTGLPSKAEHVARLPNASWQEVIGAAIRIILGITGSLTLIAMTTSGVLMLLAQGDEDKIHKAKDILLWSLVALVIIAVSYGLVVGVTNLQFFS